MNLLDFEVDIDYLILLRGYNYYLEGAVLSTQERTTDYYECVVRGSDVYRVAVQLKGNTIRSSSCTCPYDQGEFCKHEVAAFYALREAKGYDVTSFEDEDDSDDLLSDSENVDSNPATKELSLAEILNQRSKDQLISFLLKIVQDHEDIEDRIRLELQDQNLDEELRQSAELIQSYIYDDTDPFDNVGYWDTGDAVQGAEIVLGRAEAALAKGNYTRTFSLAMLVLREMVDLNEFADDSDGVIGTQIDESFYLLKIAVTEESLSDAEKEKFFRALLDEVSHKRYEGWTDWQLELLQTAAELTFTPILREEFENYLDLFLEKHLSTRQNDSYLLEEVNLIRFHLIEATDGPAKAQEFIEQNLHLPRFREIAIKKAATENNYERVLTLATEGEKVDAGFFGLSNKWQDYHYQALVRLGRLDEQRELALKFVLSGKVVRSDKLVLSDELYYYHELKKTYTPEEWKSVYPSILEKFAEQGKTDLGVYTSILIEENEKNLLLKYVKVRPDYVSQYAKYLLPDYSNEVYELFLQLIERDAARANDRKSYHHVCGIIQKLVDAGGKSQAAAITRELYETQHRRPAFRDELSKLSLLE